MIAEALLLHTPAYAGRDALPLAVPGEVLGEPCCFAKTVLVWASPANPGADTLAGDLRAAFAGIDVTTAEEMPPRATHMLLYLCEATWSDEALADQVKQARTAKLKIVMAHENDDNRDGCPFRSTSRSSGTAFSECHRS